jgi:methionyl aminopeptidase
MTIDSANDMVSLKRIGRIVALALKEMRENVHPGITTGELDKIGAAVFDQYGARSAPQLVYDFPGATCISINNEAAHGIPGNRAVQPGDLVNLDVSAELNGYFADAALTVEVPPVDTRRHNLVHCSQRALQLAIAAAQAGQPINAIGRVIAKEAASCGFNTLHDLGGHGVGRGIHEDPHNIANYYNPNDRRVLVEGLVMTIEPFLTTGAQRIYTDPDGWTLKTTDGSLSAQFEHTLVITKGKPVVITVL